MVFDEKIDGPELKEVLKAHQGDPFNDPLLMGIDEDDDDIDGKGSIGDDDEEDDEDSDNNPYYKWLTQYIVEINIINMQYSVRVLT